MYPLSNWMAALLNCRQNFSLQMWGNDDNRARRNLSSDTISIKVPQMGRINALRISNFQNKDLWGFMALPRDILPLGTSSAPIFGGLVFLSEFSICD